MRILLIEDDKALCQVLQPTLQAAGFASDCCHTGADGLHLLKTGYYDACILDRMLPELDGLTLLKSARADGVSIPVLMLTALGQIGDRVDGLYAGSGVSRLYHASYAEVLIDKMVERLKSPAKYLLFFHERISERRFIPSL